MQADILEFLTPKIDTFYIRADSTIRQVLEKFDFHKFSVVSMIDGEGKYVSSVSEGDILRYVKNHAGFDISVAENTLIAQIERYRPYKAVDLRTSMDEVFKIILDQNFVPVVDDRGVYSGIIKRKTVLEYLYKTVL